MSNTVTEKQSRFSVKSPSRGGKRNGAGRPKGSTNKITPEDMLLDFKKTTGMNFHTFVNQQILKAYQENNSELVSRYLLGFSKYLIKDVQEVDMTSGGEPIKAIFNFPNVELTDWK
jgi:hypothetical protein